MDKVVVTVDQHGNTSAASIPAGARCRRCAVGHQSGALLMLEGVGGGFTWGAVLLEVCSDRPIPNCGCAALYRLHF
jgi:3-oxoacyl-[acyl-carrier-protein] synthase-3